MAWTDKAREAAALAKRGDAQTSALATKIQAKAKSVGLTPDAYSQRRGFKDHQEHLSVLSIKEDRPN
jgi:hypothetical protein